MYLFELKFSDICPGMGLQDHMVTLFLVFKAIFLLFFIVAAPIYIPTNSVEGFLFLPILSSIYYLWLINNSHFDFCEVVLHVVSICISLIISAEKAMAPHSSTLARKIPWMEEPGGLQSMGSLRVGHD